LIDFEKACEPPASAEDIKRMRREGQIARKRNNEQEDGEFAAADDDAEDNATDGEKNKRTKTRDDSKSHIPTSSFVPRSEKPREEVIKELYPDRDQQTAFVKNLDFSITEEELVKFFDIKEEGTVKARVIKDRHTGRSKGIAYVDFESEHNLLAAIMRDGEALKGRALSIAKSRPPPSFPGSGGRGGGRGRGNAPPSSAGRGGLGFVPRAVKQKPKKALADL
jgi:RNA-binding protein 39